MAGNIHNFSVLFGLIKLSTEELILAKRISLIADQEEVNGVMEHAVENNNTALWTSLERH